MTNLEKLKQLIKLDCKDKQLIEKLEQYKLKANNTYKNKNELKLLKIALQELDRLSDHIELHEEIKVLIDKIKELEAENIFNKFKRYFTH